MARKATPRAPSSVLTPDDPLLTTTEAAALLNVSPRTVEDWRLDGKLPVAKVGPLNRFRRSAVLAMIEEAS